MRPNLRPRRSLLRASLAAALLGALAAPAHAQKTKTSPPPPAASGTVYFATPGAVHRVNPDGAGLAQVWAAPAGWDLSAERMHPSFGLYGADRWFTVVASGPGMSDTSPNGSTFAYAEVYAVHPATGTWLQLTNFGRHTDGDPLMTARRTQAVWAPGDAGITFSVVVPEQAADGTWTTHDAVYHLGVPAADLGPGFAPVAWGDPRLTRLTAAPLRVNDGQLGAWSPTGALLVNTANGISRLDPDGTLTADVIPNGRMAACAPAGDLVAYHDWLSGEGAYARVWLADSHGANQRAVTVDGDFLRWKPQFAPTGAQVAAEARRDVKTRAGWVTEYALHRFTTEGGGYVDLVPATAMSKATPKAPIGWRK